MKLDFDLDKVVEDIKKSKKKDILLQFPDGLKPKSKEILDYLSSKIKGKNFFIWGETCYGACDIPQLDKFLIIHFGHSPWRTK